MKFSFQLYSARNFQPWQDVLAMLARTGYKNVEGFGGVYEDPSAFRKLLDDNGLAMPSGHFSIDALEGDIDEVFRTAHKDKAWKAPARKAAARKPARRAAGTGKPASPRRRKS